MMAVTDLGGGDGELTVYGEVQIPDNVRFLKKIGNSTAEINTNPLIFIKVKKIS